MKLLPIPCISVSGHHHPGVHPRAVLKKFSHPGMHDICTLPGSIPDSNARTVSTLQSTQHIQAAEEGHGIHVKHTLPGAMVLLSGTQVILEKHIISI